MERTVISIKQFLDEEGRIVRLPTKRSVRIAVLEYLADKFECNKQYKEKEINDICNCWHTFEDYFILRRGLVDEGFLSRKKDGSCYWRNNSLAPEHLDIEVNQHE